MIAEQSGPGANAEGPEVAPIDSPPLLRLSGVRVDVDGVPRLEGCDGSSRGRHLGLIGDWSALFALLGRRARLVRGCAEVHGAPAERAVADGVVGLAPYDPPLPASMSARTYLETSARLAGLRSSRASEEARRVLHWLRLEYLASRRTAELGTVERRGLTLAHATLGDPATIVCETPLANLDDRAAGVMAGWLEQVLTTRRLIASVRKAEAPGPERSLLDRLGDVWVRNRLGLLEQGSPSELLGRPPAYLVSVAGLGEQLLAALTARGLRAQMAAAPDAEAAFSLLVEVGTPEALDSIRDAIVEVGAPVFHLGPVAE